MLCDELHMCGTHGEKKELPSLLLAAAALYTRLNKWNIEGFFGVFFVVVCPKFQHSVYVPHHHHPKNSMKNAVGAGRVHTD